MATVILTDPEQATLAGAWCVENIGYKYWDMKIENLFSPGVSYNFSFKDPRRATEFALRWL